MNEHEGRACHSERGICRTPSSQQLNELACCLLWCSLGKHSFQFRHELVWLWKATTFELGVQDSAVVSYLKRVDRFEGLCNNVETIDTCCSDELVLLHLDYRSRRRSAHDTKQLLAEEKDSGDACLSKSNGTDAILD